MIKINVITNNTNWLNYIKNPNDYLDRKVNRINIKSKLFVKKRLFCTLLLSGNNEIKSLNKKFRNKNKITDILSFPFQSKLELEKKLKKDNEIYLGDIIILRDFKIEFDRLWIHGLVHLFGHDHKKDKDYLKMHKIEKKYFSLING